MTEVCSFDWQIAVFGQNEARRIGGCVSSIGRAAAGRRVLVTVILNGCTDGSGEAALHAAREASLPIDIWRISYADKANAINRFFHELRVPSHFYCCVDAYALLATNALSGMEQCFQSRPSTRLAAGVPSNGRSEWKSAAKSIRQGGVVHGQLYSPARDFLDRLADRGLRLPIGLYRGDGLLGSMAAHDLDAIGTPWDNERVPGVAEATFQIDSLSLMSPNDLRRQFRRKVRQMRGVLENAAIKQVIYAGGYEALPAYADDMIASFLRTAPLPRVTLLDRPFMMRALRQHDRAVKVDHAKLCPVRTASENLQV